MFKQLKCKNGPIHLFEINEVGTVRCKIDHSHPIVTRIKGKRKPYRQVQLLHNGIIKWYLVHRLMAYSWLGPRPHYLRRIVDHRDGNGLNNKIDNLRWVTSSANQLNKEVNGIIECEETKMYYPIILKFVHVKYGTPCLETCKMLRKNLVECYIRYNCRFPECGRIYPHYSIHKY